MGIIGREVLGWRASHGRELSVVLCMDIASVYIPRYKIQKVFECSRYR